MSEWLKEHAWKACVGETLPWVRIPLSPPNLVFVFFLSKSQEIDKERFLSANAPVSHELLSNSTNSRQEIGRVPFWVAFPEKLNPTERTTAR